MKISLRQPYSFNHIGHRKNQEDSRYPDEDRPEGKPRVFVVCDGVGGQDKGEVASSTVADAIGEYMERVDLDEKFEDGDFALMLDSAYRALFRAMTDDTREMATTLTFVCFHRGGVTCAHMGDSRIYHIRPGKGVLYRSYDHSLVNALVRASCITPQEAVNHPKSNVITRCMAWVEPGHDRPGATLRLIDDVEPGDYFFLCSDGVLEKIDDQMLVDILSDESLSDKDKIDRISALSSAAADNNTAYLIPVDSVELEDSDNLPVAAAIVDEEDDSELDAPAESHNTAKLEHPMPQARDVEPASSPAEKFSSKISRFFRKLFN